MESLGKIIIIALVVIVMGYFPISAMLNNQDEISQMKASSALTTFINDILSTRQLTTTRHANFMSEIATTGLAYNLELEHKKLDENYGKKGQQVNLNIVGERSYYTVYTVQILEQLNEATDDAGIGVYFLKQNDLFSGQLVNTSKTAGEVMQQFLFRNESTARRIVASHGGMVP